MATTLFIVIVAFIVSWVPTFVADQTLFKRSDFHHNISFGIHLTLWAIYISPTVNPIIYALHNNTIRKLVIQCIQCEPNSHLNNLIHSNRARRLQRGESAGLDDVKAMNPATAFRPEKRRSSTQSNSLKINLVLPAVLKKKKRSVIDNQIGIPMEMVILENLCEENTPVMVRDTSDNDITRYPTSADESIIKKRSNSLWKLKIRGHRTPEKYFGSNSNTTIWCRITYWYSQRDAGTVWESTNHRQVAVRVRIHDESDEKWNILTGTYGSWNWKADNYKYMQKDTLLGKKPGPQ